MATRQKRLLLTVDGSENAMQTVKYAGEEESFKGMKIVIFHVYKSIPQAYYDLEKEPKSVKVVGRVRSWESEQKNKIRKYMDDAKQMLLDAGHAEPAVDIKIKNRKKGVAWDIITEAQKGYDAVLVHRRGASALQNIIIGSVTMKLLEKQTFVPLLIAGFKPINKKVLVAVDGSPCATRAIHFVADMLGPLKDYKVRLLHAVRGGFHPDLADADDDVIAEMDSVFIEPVKILEQAGFEPDNISTKTVTGASSRAGAIVDAAHKGGWATIVVGRRGLSEISEFFMGRVSNKVVHAARKDTVWIIT